MSKQSGLGSRFLVAGYDISGDVQALDSVGASTAMLDVTDITQPAHSRIGGLRDGMMSFTSYFDDANSVPVLDALPTSDVQMMFLVPTLAVGAPAAVLNAKQVSYDPSRGTDGSLTFKTEGQGNGYALEWGVTLTAGVMTQQAPGSAAALNQGAATAYGAQAYLQVTQFTGTSVTVTVEHSADGSTYSPLMAFTAVAAAPAAQRISVSNSTTVGQYVQVTTTGTFTSAEFAVVFIRNLTSGVSF